MVGRSLKLMRRLTCGPAACMAGLMALSLPAQAEIEIRTNEQVIESLLKRHTLDIADPLAVFRAVIAGLPAEVTVYPTENYYYFYFTHNGLNYSGNIRFDAPDQFDGKVHFAYFRDYTFWTPPLPPTYRKLGPDEGVKVEQLGPLQYRVTADGRSVTFNLVDLSEVKPPQGALLPDEIYIGPVFDESAVQFYLVFNKPSKTFLYILNEEAPATDILLPSEAVPGVSVGARTSFAYVRDRNASRKILVGVFSGNTEVNNMLDGPFDQLPDNFIAGETLRDALLQIDPSMEGKIDRYGSLPDGSERFAITSYVYYDFPADLKSVVECAEAAREDAMYYACFNGEAREDNPPEASKPEPQKSN
jgi:hypothetical protein